MRANFGLQSTTREYFEAHEGKNTSDTIRSIIKCAYVRVMTNHPDGVHCAADVVNLLSIVPESTEKFKFFVIENCPEIDRVPAEDQTGLPMKDIMKMHSILNIEKGLLAHKVTCIECTPSTMCEKCFKLPPTKKMH